MTFAPIVLKYLHGNEVIMILKIALPRSSKVNNAYTKCMLLKKTNSFKGEIW